VVDYASLYLALVLEEESHLIQFNSIQFKAQDPEAFTLGAHKISG